MRFFVTGRLFGLVVAGVIPVLIFPHAVTALLWVTGALVLAGLDLALARPVGSIRLGRAAIAPIRLGGSAITELHLDNPGDRTFAGLVRDAWEPSAGAVDNRHRVNLPPGEHRILTTALTPTRRGDRLAVGVTLRSLGPLGLAGRQRTVPVPGKVRALPPFESRRLLPSRLAALRQLDGRSAVRIRGQGTEFDSLRDYVEGDDVRSIDWRASARHGSTVVRTWQPEKDRHIVLVLDTSRTSAVRVGDAPRLDAAMDAALLLASLASAAGDRVDLLAGDRQVHARVVGSPRTTLLNDLVTAMAPLEPALVEADWSRLAGEVTRISRQRALLVLLTPLDPAAVAESLLPPLTVLAGRYRVLVASVADPEIGRLLDERDDAEQIYRAAAAARDVAGRERTRAALSRLGVDVVEAEPRPLPAALADRYLTLKARGLL